LKSKSLKARNNAAYLYLLPWLVGILLLQLYPFIISFYYALCDYNPLKKPFFIGLENYFQLFSKDPEFWISLKATLLYVIYTVPCKLLMSLFIAMLLNKARRGIGVLRTLYYLPSLFGGSVAVAVLWQVMFREQGMVNSWINFFGFPSVQFLGDPKIALPTLSGLEVWQFGSSMVMFLAALKQVPNTLYEAARIDGAGRLKDFSALPCLIYRQFFSFVS